MDYAARLQDYSPTLRPHLSRLEPLFSFSWRIIKQQTAPGPAERLWRQKVKKISACLFQTWSARRRCVRPAAVCWRSAWALLSCHYNLSTDTLLMSYPLWACVAQIPFPSIISVHSFTVWVESTSKIHARQLFAEVKQTFDAAAGDVQTHAECAAAVKVTSLHLLILLVSASRWQRNMFVPPLLGLMMSFGHRWVIYHSSCPHQTRQSPLPA